MKMLPTSSARWKPADRARDGRVRGEQRVGATRRHRREDRQPERAPDLAAERARRRSAFAAASLAFERAGELSSEQHDQVGQLIAAAENAWLGGRVDRAWLLPERARPILSEPLERAEVDRWQGLIEMNRGRPVEGYQVLMRAANEVAQLDEERALDLLNLASAAAAYAGDKDAQVAVAQAARDVPARDGPFARMLAALLGGIGAYADGDFATSVTELRLALELAEELDEPAAVTQPLAVLFAGRAALYLGDDRAAYRAHREAATRAREAGALGALTQVLPILTITEVWAGRWDSGSANAREGLRLGREAGQDHLVAQALVLVALIAALRGDEEDCRSLAAESRDLASAHGLGVVAEITQWALALLELGLGRAGEALSRAREISDTTVVDWSVLDRIEAAVRAGEKETAHDWLDSFESWADSTAAAWAGAVALHCHALLAEEDGEAERLFAAALDAHAAEATRPFERARTELASVSSCAARAAASTRGGHLRAALDAFEALGAGSWSERARVELRASEQTARKRDPSTRDQLTPQELQIVGFVAQGLSDRDVAAQLFLTPRTVAFHPRNVFRKLDITSRTELARLDLDSVSENVAPAADPAIRPVRA